MKTLLTLALASALLMLTSLTACGQSVGQDEAARKARILDNLRHYFPQLEQYQVEMGEIVPSDVEGLEYGTFIVNGQQEQPFLVSTDDTQLYLVSAGPLDVSKTAEELAAEAAAAEAEAAAEARVRHAALMEAVEDFPSKGRPDAPITIIEFSDFQCPFARATETVRELLDKYPDELRLIYVEFPLDAIHPWARRASLAATCAAGQDTEAFWRLHDFFFDNQGDVNPENVYAQSRTLLADQEGFDVNRWSTCVEDEDSPRHLAAAARVESAVQLGTEYGVNGTPGFFINGHFLNGSQPLEAFEEVLEMARTK